MHLRTVHDRVAIIEDWQSCRDEVQLELRRQTLLYGVIIVGELPDGRLFYMNRYEQASIIDNPNAAEDPYQCRRLATLVKRLETIPEFYAANIRWSLALWVHPDSDIRIPIDRYQKMTGQQFPGCPTQ